MPLYFKSNPHPIVLFKYLDSHVFLLNRNSKNRHKIA